MSVLGDVLDQVRAGVSVDRIPGVLGADPGLVASALDHWTRLGVLLAAGDALQGCGGGCPPADTRSLACAGCVFVDR